MTRVIAAVVTLLGGLAALWRWQRNRARARADREAAARAEAERAAAATKDALKRTAGAVADAQEGHHAASPLPTDPADPIEAARARVARAEAAARSVRDHLDAAHRDGRLPPR